MATMSIGIAFAVLGSVAVTGGPMGYWSALKQSVRDPSVRKYLWVAHAVNFACLVSLIGADFFPLELGGEKPEVRYFKDLWKCWYLYWPIFLVPGFRALSSERRTRLLDIWTLAAVILSVIGLQQFFTGWPRPRLIPGLEPYYHVQGLYGHHLSYANLLIFPLFYLLLLPSWRTEWFKNPLVRYGSAAITGIALFGTFSRMLWIALPIGLVVSALIKLKPRARIGAVIALVIVGLGAFQIPAVKTRVLQSMGTSDRITLWKINTYFFQERPITGVGWHHNLTLSHGYYKQFLPDDPFKFVGHAHSNFFEVIGALGLIGLIAYIAWNVFVLKRSYWVSKGFFVAWIVFQVNGLTQVNFWEAKVLHMMGFVLAWTLVWSIEGENDDLRA